MEKSTKSGEQGKALESPSREMVRKWVARDIDAAAVFLNMVRKHPDVVERIADELYDKSQEREKDIEQLEKAGS